ncbi:SUF system NifU family Fe-S cluster assembly protein [Candidatus Woesearchaeota archaeon]|nr:SUF system NifU family Fe-S cluster assembly protein [Candidatus Woesearchaeota archaeon]
MDIYMENILDHWRNPRNSGNLKNPDITFFDNNPLCGDEIKLQLVVSNNIVQEVKFLGRGCSISQAAADLLSDFIKGKSLDEIKNIKNNQIIEMLGIPIGPVRIKCALLALLALKKGIYIKEGIKMEDNDLNGNSQN